MANSPPSSRRRRFSSLPPWLRPQYRRFKPPLQHPRRLLRPVCREEASPPLEARGRSRAFPPWVKLGPMLEDERGSDLPDLVVRSHMQFPPEAVLRSGELNGRGRAQIWPQQEKPSPEAMRYPGLSRPAQRSSPDLREWIRKRTKPPPPPPPLITPPPSYRPSKGLPYGPRFFAKAQQRPVWTEPYRWASGHFGAAPLPGISTPTLRMGPVEGPTTMMVRTRPNLTRMQHVLSADRRTWMPGDMAFLPHPLHQDLQPPLPRDAPHFTSGPWTAQYGSLFERGKTPQGPASQAQWRMGPGTSGRT